MRLGGEPESSNFEDRTGQSSSGFGGLGGGGGSALGCLLPMVMSRFGLGGVVVLVIGYFILSSLGGLGGGGGLLPSNAPQQRSTAPGQSTLDPKTAEFLKRVLGSTEQTWTEILAKQGQRYQPTKMVAYSGGTQTECGFGQAAAGPFYCPNDQTVYIDPSFANELSQRFGAPGDAAMAYVIAHEVGHHIQDLQGTLNKANQLQARASKTEGNAVQVRVELQADCYAGVWAANARDEKGSILEPGDAEEAMRAAEAVGDDTLQKQAQGYVVPDSFTHGSSAQRIAAFQQGLKGANLAACKAL